MMRIAIVTNILTPYRINFFDNLNQELKLRGGVLRVYAMCKEKNDRPWKYDSLRREYTEVLPGRKLKIKGIYVFFNKVKKALKNFNPDIVICAGSYWLPTVYKVVKYKKKLKYKVFMWNESHEKEQKNNSKFRIRIRETIRKDILRKFDGFLYASNLARALVEKYAHPKAQYFELPNTVNEKEFSQAHLNELEYRNEIRKLHQIDENDFVFFTAARLSPEKGLLNFCDSIKNLSKETKEKITFLIAGTGPLEEKIKEKAKEYGLKMTLIGQKSQQEIIRYYGACDCFLLPSLSDPNPLSVIECLWAGKPLLIADGVGNQFEAIKPGENGFVFNYNDEIGVLDAVNALVSFDCEWRLNAKKVSLKIAQTRYSTQNVIINLVDQLVGDEK